MRDPAAKARIHDEILPALMADTAKARMQQSDGKYVRATALYKGAPAFNSQEFLMKLAEGKADLDAIPEARLMKGPARQRAPKVARKADAAD